MTAGSCFLENAPENALCARIAGDEFLIFYHGYENRALIRQEIQTLFENIRACTFHLPDGTNHGISASGGVAWYPDDTDDLYELMRYADFAMYCVKKAERGTVGEFDLLAYRDMQQQNLRLQEFYQLLEHRQLYFHFQPIFSARTGAPFAYEALMRANTPNIHSPFTVLELAKKSNRMQDVETLVFFTATETYETLLAQNQVPSDALLFINSISNTCMPEKEEQRFHERFSHLQHQLVLEFTETETLDLKFLRKKQSMQGFSGLLALDDYGSGYNSELNLLELNPAFIKVDMAIVRNIHLDENKQQLVNNIVKYAHKRQMQIIAEGLETPEEVRTCLDLDVDLLQGYFLSRPSEIPTPISEEARALIDSYWKERT